jgi:hypothetical protein
VTDEELEAIAVESKRTIDIDEFVPKEEIDQLYNVCHARLPGGDPEMRGRQRIRGQIANDGSARHGGEAEHRVAPDHDLESIKSAAERSAKGAGNPGGRPQPTRMRKSLRRSRSDCPIRDASPLASWV